LNAFKERDMLDKITALSMNAMDNIAFRYTDDLKIELGSMDNLEYKLDMMSEIISSLGDNPKGLINMENPENPTYRQTID
jgi:hypothetical protein